MIFVITLRSSIYLIMRMIGLLFVHWVVIFLVWVGTVCSSVSSLMIVLTGDVKHFPNVNGVTEQGDIEINAPAFCDPGTSDRSNGTRMCSRDDILRAIALRPLSFEPWTRPLYSNTGFNLLGWATAHAANRNASRLEFQILEPEIEKKGPTLEELLHEDVFGPLGMKDTSFWVPLDKRDNVAVPARGVPNMIDWEFTSTFNP